VFNATRQDWGLTYKAILSSIRFNGILLGKSKTLYNLYFEMTPNEVFILPEKNWKWAFVELFDRFNSQYENPGDSYQFRPHWKTKLEKEGGKFIYNYHDRLWPSITNAIDILHKNKYERDAVISIFNSNDTERPKGTRTPCTQTLHLYTDHNGFINMHVNMRTNDVVNLLIYDVFHHSMILNYVCGVLDKPVGKYSHFTPIAYYQKKREERGYIDRMLDSEIKVYHKLGNGITELDFSNFTDSCNAGIMSRKFFSSDVMEDITASVISLLFKEDSIKFKNEFFNKVFKREENQ